LPETQASRELARARERLSRTETRLRIATDELIAAREVRAAAETKTRRALDEVAVAAQVGLTEGARGTVIVIGAHGLFASGERRLLARSEALLGPIAEALSQVRGHRILVEDHTAGHGPEEFDPELSQARAEAVRAFFVSRGVPADRVAAGSGRPSRDDAARTAGSSQESRVEIIVESPNR
jgi:OOP family OmpA-OmpF porin